MKVKVGYTKYVEKEFEIPDEILEDENETSTFCLDNIEDGNIIGVNCVKSLDDEEFYYEW